MAAREVVVIGGGLIGCAVARELVRNGSRVVLIDRDVMGRGTSGDAAGVFGFQGQAQDDLIRTWGAESRRLFPGLVTELEEESGIQLDVRDSGTICVALGDADEPVLDETIAIQAKFGFRFATLTRSEVRSLEPRLSSRVRRGVLLLDEGNIDSRALTHAWAEAARRAGCELREGVEVCGLVTEAGRVAGVETAAGRIPCDAVVNAAGAWAGSIPGVPPMPVRPVREQIVVIHAGRPFLRRAVYSHRGYAVGRRNGSVLLGSTREESGFDERVTAGGVQAVLRAALEMLPGLRHRAVSETWAGLRPATPDGRPILGADPTVEGLFWATGHDRHGVLLAPATALLVLAAMRGESSPWLDAFRPGRFRP